MKYLTLLTVFADEITDSIWAGIARFIMYIPNLIFLFVDAIVYSVLAYAYKLFEIMARLNFMSIKIWFDPILSNIKQLTIVVVMFAIGYALIRYLINPDKISDQKVGGMALIKNIAIAGVLFIAVEVFFPLMNEVTFLLIGAPEGYTYSSVLEQFGVTNDGGQGLIANVIYGNNGSDSDEETTDFGTSLAVNTLHVFLHSKYSGTVVDKAYQDAMEGKDFSLMGITAGFTHIEIFLENGKEGTIEYKYPVLSTLVGLFLVYTLGTIAIELGIRALKLIMLEVLAPIAIVTIIKDGWDAKIWKNWWSVYWKTYLDVFLRVASMYLIVGLIAKVFNNVSDLITDSVNTGSFTTYIVMIVITIAGFKLAKELPKFIDDIFGSHLASNNKDGLKNFLKGIGTGLGTAAGVTAGVATGVTSGISNKAGVLGTTWNALKGGVSGGVAGSKGKGIADTMKKISENNKANITRAQAIGRQGGGLRYLGANIEKGFGVPQRNINQRQSLLDENTLIDNVINAQGQEIKGKNGSFGLKYGADRDAYAQSYAQKATTSQQSNVNAAQYIYNEKYADYNAKLQNLQSQFAAGKTMADYYAAKAVGGSTLDSIFASGVAPHTSIIDFDVAESEKNTAEANLNVEQTKYNTAYSAAVTAGENDWMSAASAAQGTAVKAAKDELRIKNGNTVGMNQAQLRTLKKTNKANADAIASKGSVRRYERQGHYSSK